MTSVGITIDVDIRTINLFWYFFVDLNILLIYQWFSVTNFPLPSSTGH